MSKRVWISASVVVAGAIIAGCGPDERTYVSAGGTGGAGTGGMAPSNGTTTGGMGGAGGGGSGTSGAGGNPAPGTFTFEWTSMVAAIQNDLSQPATVAGVSVGDSFLGTVTYAPDDFGVGQNVSGDGLDYPAPPGLMMSYQFESGAHFAETITDVRARDGGAFDQWNWDGGAFGGLLVQVNDPSDAPFTLPLSTSFADLHAIFFGAQASFNPADGNHYAIPAASPADARRILLGSQAFTVKQN